MQSYILSVLVNNHFGVLTRISGLFTRRGYNIKSLTVGETREKAVSRMTIEVVGDENTVRQIQNQLSKIVDVISVTLLEPDKTISRELFLVKVAANDNNRTAIISLCDIFRARTVSVSPENMVLEITGDENKLSAFIEMMDQYGILEISRTGVTAISRNN